MLDAFTKIKERKEVEFGKISEQSKCFGKWVEKVTKTFENLTVLYWKQEIVCILFQYNKNKE